MRVIMKYKLRIIFSLSLVFCAGLLAQERKDKLAERLTVNDDVNLNLNASHTKIVFETWNKSVVEVEAFLEGNDLSDQNSQRILDSWRVDFTGDNQNITINSVVGNTWTENVTAANIQMSKEELRMLGPLISDMLGPIMKNIANNPMPSALSNRQSNVSINRGVPVESDEKYIQQWESQIKEKFGDDTKYDTKEWVKKLKENGVDINAQMELRLEAWGQQYGQQMQAWASQFAKDFENQPQGQSFTVYRYASGKTNSNNVSKVIKVRMPKEAALKLNIRHGDVQLAERSKNVKASLSHTKLSANVIEGNQTFIKVSYSPVFVREWNNGKLVVNYVKNCRIQNAKNLLANADSSNIYIQQLDENGAISGSFGVVTIANLSESFSTLDLAVQNSDFKLKLPNTAFNLSYSGLHSLVSVPKTLEISARKNFGNVFINGYQNTRSTDKIITINAKYSELVLNK